MKNINRIILSLLLLVLSINVIACSGPFSDDGFNINVPGSMGSLVWPITDLTAKIPRPDSEIGKIVKLTQDCFIVNVGDFKQEDFKNYCDMCRSYGFNEELSYSTTSLFAISKSGHSLYLKYDSNSNIMYVRIEKSIFLKENSENFNILVGESVDLRNCFKVYGAEIKDCTYLCTESDAIKVDNGVVTGIKPGYSKITIKYKGDKNISCTFTITVIK